MPDAPATRLDAARKAADAAMSRYLNCLQIRLRAELDDRQGEIDRLPVVQRNARRLHAMNSATAAGLAMTLLDDALGTIAEIPGGWATVERVVEELDEETAHIEAFYAEGRGR
jgi:hypothetical protein